ncbi:hypothetical protein MASR2M39_13570 [Ignavibacteriales bacterium]
MIGMPNGIPTIVRQVKAPAIIIITPTNFESDDNFDIMSFSKKSFIIRILPKLNIKSISRGFFDKIT